MRVAIRADASVQMGTGHTVRCLSLAFALRQRGINCHFIQRAHPGHMAGRIRQAGFAVTLLPAPDGAATKSGEDYAAWLGVEVDRDAEETRAALEKIKPDWLVVDHYALGRRWEARVRPAVGRILAIDDLADRPHDCDVLLDQNYFRDAPARYDGLLPDSATLLTGPRFALLRAEYGALRRLMGPRRGPVSRVLVFYGGSDLTNETGRALRVLSRPEFEHLAVDVVVGSNHPAGDEIARLAAARPGTDVFGPQEQLASLMAEADLALGAGGTTTWERCALGLPSIVTAIARHQEPFNAELARDGAIRYLGLSEDITDDDLAAACRALIGDPAGYRQLAQTAWQTSDGLGVWRVVETLSPTAPGALSRTVKTGDSDTSDSPIASVAVTTPEALPVGTLRIREGTPHAWLDYQAAPEFDRPQIHRQLLESAVTAWRDLATSGTAGFLTLPRSQGDTGCGDDAAALPITVLSNRSSWMNDYIPGLLAAWLQDGHAIRWVHAPEALQESTLCFFLGCGQIVPAEDLEKMERALLVHESDLPAGRGWSPLTWQVLQGGDRIPVTLLEAVAEVDAGDIYDQQWIDLDGSELVDELRAKQADATLELCRKFVRQYPDSRNWGRPQQGQASWFDRRGPADSELDAGQSLRDQFNLLRVVDNERYPAFFRYQGHRYLLRISRERDD